MPDRQTNDQHDELDLIQLIKKQAAFARRYRRILIGFTLAGLIAGLGFYFRSPKLYGAKMVIHSHTLTNQEQILIIQSWVDLLKRKEIGALAATLNTNPVVFRNLAYLYAEEIQKINYQNNPHGFIIKVKVKDTAVLDELEAAIVYGLENSPYISQRLAVKRGNFTELINQVSSEIRRLDSVKRSIEYAINNNTGSSSSFIIDVSGINTQLIALHEKRLHYREELRFAKAVQVLQHFNRYSKPDKKSILKPVVIGLAAGFFIGFIISLMLYIRQKIR